MKIKNWIACVGGDGGGGGGGGSSSSSSSSSCFARHSGYNFILQVESKHH